MEKIDFTKPGGYRLKQFTFSKLQSAYFEVLKAFITHLNISDSGNYIISGCQISGSNITAGIMFIDGELCPFAQVAGTNATKIKKNIQIQTLSFKNGTNPDIFRTTTAVVDAAGTALSEFVRFYPVYDQNYVHTDFNFSQIFRDKLIDIEEGAQVNVFADFLAAVGTPGHILNKPTIPNILWHHTSIIGDPLFVDNAITITFPDVGTSDYMVVYCPVSLSDGGIDNDLVYVVKNKTPTSFALSIREISPGVQNIAIDYFLIKLT